MVGKEALRIFVVGFSGVFLTLALLAIVVYVFGLVSRLVSKNK